jgi:hypothetical protein
MSFLWFHHRRILKNIREVIEICVEEEKQKAGGLIVLSVSGK